MIYVASSWRNLIQPMAVALLREVGCTVYDFRNPAPGQHGFAWAAIDPNWEQWTPAEYRAALEHPIARAGYESDRNALDACDACLLVLPSGRSASWEFGYACGRGKRGAVLMLEPFEPELMYRGYPILVSLAELRQWAIGEAAAESSRREAVPA